MDARQRCSKSALTKLHECAGSLSPSARPVAFDQRYCSANYNVQQNIRIIKIKDFVVCSAECSAVHPW